jgi:hypothetical protein
MRITFNTADVAHSHSLDCGLWHLDVVDDKMLEILEALQILGFSPEVSL